MDEEGEDGEKLKEELCACQHFLVDTETINGRHKVINKNIEDVFNKLDSDAKINIALGFVLQNTDTGEYR